MVQFLSFTDKPVKPVQTPVEVLILRGPVVFYLFCTRENMKAVEKGTRINVSKEIFNYLFCSFNAL